MTSVCCICLEKSESLEKSEIKEYSCLADHNVCKTCFLSVLQMCYCKNTFGEIVYKCPLCRIEYRYSNKKMNRISIMSYWRCRKYEYCY